MYYLNNDFNYSPYFNLSLEEYFLKNSKDDFFILWQNEPTVVVGLHQNTNSEISIDYTQQKSINIVRRMTGGGAVYHDFGNVNFSFIENCEDRAPNFKKYADIIIAALRKFSVEAYFSGRNDILIDDKKISGNAAMVFGNRILHHGTLLFNANSKDIFEALNTNSAKFEGKSVQSVRSRVANIIDYMPETITVKEFIDKIMNEVIVKFPNAKKYVLSEKDIAEIKNLADKKYNTWEWNFGNSPKYNFTKKTKINAGTFEIYLEVNNSIIKEAKIYGDFFSIGNIKDIENMLIEQKHEMQTLKDIFSKINLDNYFVNIGLEEFISCFF